MSYTSIEGGDSDRNEHRVRVELLDKKRSVALEELLRMQNYCQFKRGCL